MVEAAIRTFVAAVREAEPRTSYEAYRREAGPGFIHFMAFPDAAAERAHQQAGYTAAFVEALYPRCVESPRFTKLEMPGAS